MKFKFLAMAGLTAGLMLSACSKDDPKPKLSFIDDEEEVYTEETPSSAEVTVTEATYDISKTYQKVAGFGAMYPIVTWGVPSITAKQVDAIYNDFGLNIVRLYIYPDKGKWSTDINLIKRAVENGAIVLACPWEAPAGMLDTQTKNVWDDGIKDLKEKEVKHLKHDSYQAYADHLVSYVDYMKNQGIEIHAMSVQNEPDAEFMYWSPDEILNFVEKYGKYISEKTGVKLISPEACGMDPSYTNKILNSKDAFAATDIIAGHLYQGFSNIDNVHAVDSYVKSRYTYINTLWSKVSPQNKNWWMTEHLFNHGEKSSNPSDWVFLNWDYCINHLALEIHDCMAASASAYVYWYIKRFYGLIYDTDKRSGSYKENSYSHNAFIMAQWAKFATGKTRIEAACSNKNVKITAYKSDDGKQLSFVAINYSSKPKYIGIPVDAPVASAEGITCDETCQKKQKITNLTPNCEDGKVIFTVPAMGISSVTISL